MRNRNVMRSPSLLAGFEAAARHLSFTKAGAELFLTQSAVSRQIKELEDQLGLPLFHRRHRALVLTEAGQQFYRAGGRFFLPRPAVSRQIKELEDLLALPLFHRRHRALVLTEAGQQFYAAAA